MNGRIDGCIDKGMDGQTNKLMDGFARFSTPTSQVHTSVS